MIEARKAVIHRKTRETDVHVEFHADADEPVQTRTGVPFLDHMLTAFACHGRFALTVGAEGDLEVDPHHTVEDVGIVLGQAIRHALGEDYRGIERAGSFSFPMDGTLTTVALDLCGRPTLVWNVAFGPHAIGTLDPNLFRDFFKGLADSMRAALHVHTVCQDNDHHLVESIFKGFGRALRVAVARLPENRTLSTKGRIDAG